MCKYEVKKLPNLHMFLTRYVPDQNKMQQMCDRVILKNGATLKSVSNCYKNQGMCNKAVDNYLDAL